MNSQSIYKIIQTESPKSKQHQYSKEKLEHLPNPKIFNALDVGQISAVLSESPKTLVLAGAGAGKTNVITKRILHLVHNKKIPAHNILAMTFTKSATREMQDRLIAEIEPKYKEIVQKLEKHEVQQLRRELLANHPEIRSVSIKTIHSLANQILKTDGAKVYNTNFKIITDEEHANTSSTQQSVIKSILSTLTSSDHYAEKLKQFIIDYLTDYNKIIAPEIKTSGLYVTIDGKQVRSKSERDIANFLVQNNIRYEYEWETKWADEPFHPDFYLPDFDIYIEHWLVSSENEKMAYKIKGFDKQKYLKTKKWKTEQFKQHKKTLVETHESQTRANIQDFFGNLYAKLLKATNNTISTTPSKNFLENFANLSDGMNLFITSAVKLINLAKSLNIPPEKIKENLESEKHEEIIKFYNLFLPLYKEYSHYLIKKSLLDFNDMLYKTIRLLLKHKQILAKYQRIFRHILIDEYQDVSSAQVKLIKLLCGENGSLFAVGDDWQSIYSFRGAEISYILDFQKHFPKAEIFILPFNYRSGKNIVLASSALINKNKQRFTKKIKPFNAHKDEKIFQFNALNEEDGADFIINTTDKLLAQGCSITDFLVLYRRSTHLTPYLSVFKKRGFTIPTKTIHSSKGTEAKIVFLIGLHGGSFPYVWEDTRIVQVIKQTDLLKKEEEERRTFYVAMTRAKEKLFLISEKANESEYCTDIPEKFKKVQVSEKEFTVELLTPMFKQILQGIKKGQTTQELSVELNKKEFVIEKAIATLIRHGLLDVAEFVSHKVYEIINQNISSSVFSAKLSAIKKDLPPSISYSEIRFVLADLKRNFHTAKM